MKANVLFPNKFLKVSKMFPSKTLVIMVLITGREETMYLHFWFSLHRLLTLTLAGYFQVTAHLHMHNT